jgi:hypothetical protein
LTVRLFLLLCFFLPARLFAAEPSPGMELVRQELSPRKDIHVEHYVNAKTYDREVWLAPVSKEADRVLLYKHGRSVDILFSPDEQWLIVNDFLGSNQAEPILFKHRRSVEYTGVDNSIGEKVWQLVGKDYPIVLSQDFGHQYVEALRWSNDSKAFLLAAYGHLDDTDRQSLDPWLCVFKVADFSLTLDLRPMNGGALVYDRMENSPRGPWR